MDASGDLTSSFSLYWPNSKASVGANLLEKNLAEIQNLHQRLEASVTVNDHLRERLEHVLSHGDQGKGELHSRGCQNLLLNVNKDREAGSRYR
ncbi:myomegalin-like isoform X2 [Callithrix jacchus]